MTDTRTIDDRTGGPPPLVRPEDLPKFDDAVEKAKAAVSGAKWKRQTRRLTRGNVQPARCGRLVLREERSEFMDKISDKMCSDDFHLLGFFLFRYGPGAPIKLDLRGLAGALGKSKDTVNTIVKSLNDRGFLLIKSGRKSRQTNVYAVTWPEGDPSVAPRRERAPCG
jgi:hypothetical protein